MAESPPGVLGTIKALSPQARPDENVGASQVGQARCGVGRGTNPHLPACTLETLNPSCSQQWKLFLSSPRGSHSLGMV